MDESTVLGVDFPQNHVSLELQPNLEASARARDAISSGFWGLPERVSVDLLTVVTELVANAVQHGQGKPIGLRVSLDPKREVIRGEVIDQGDASRSIPRIREGTENRVGGYGLRIVDTLTSEWYVAEGSTSVRFEMPLESP